jgi:hypothetical protein
MSTLTEQYAYGVHGVDVAVGGDAHAMELLHTRLEHFRIRDLREGVPLTIALPGVEDGRDHPVVEPCGPARPIYDVTSTTSVSFHAGDHLYVEYDGVRGFCHPSHGALTLSFLRQNVRSRWLAVHPLFTILFVEALKRRGLFSVHAAGLCLDGQGVVVAGPSGSGKTTVTLALLRAGFEFLGDDIVFLSDRDGELRMLAFPDETNVTTETAEWFPELRARIAAVPPVHHKHALRAEALYGATVTWGCRPAAVVFPSIAPGEDSTVTPIDHRATLLKLASNVLLTEPRSSQAHLDILGRLATESRCYNLATGRDFDRLPILMRTLLNA